MTTPEKREKLKIFLKKNGYDQNRLSEIFEVTQPAISALLNGKKAFGKKTAALWAKKLGLNASWLLTGEGEMLKSNQGTADATTLGKMIPFYDAEAAAGSEYGMNMQAVSQPVGMIEIGSILRDSESALRVYGNSMVPNYPAGCVVGLKKHIDSFIEPGTVFVIETADNRYIKRLYYNADKSAFRCISDNTMKHDDGPMRGEFIYQEFEIPLQEVKRLFRVTGVIKRNIL